jgi:cellulose synthase (UDP-forming)
MLEKVKMNRGWISLNISIWFGFVTLLFYYTWWLTPQRLTSPVLLFLFACAVVYGAVQLAATWVLYLAANRQPLRQPQQVDPSLTVDVLITVYDESVALIERCVCAARDMNGAHRTWLLDDAQRPELRTLAQSLGVGYLSRKQNVDYKAGNINAALARTDGDIVVIFDVDHVPVVSFLEQTLGYFSNPEIGFVQVMLTFAYEKDRPTGKAASESSLDFYNPASRGADALGAATLIGSNALIRREALDSIGGYHPGLAEDLATSIALHAAGWQSVYVSEPLAPGLAPPDLRAWFDQQIKWSRGVFELLRTKYFHYWPSLTYGQRLGYAVRMTYYWIGPLTALHLLIPIFLLFLSSEAALKDFNQYILHMVPLALAVLAIRGVALRHHASASVKSFLENPVYLQWKPLMLVLGTWPVYTLSWFLALFRVDTGFRPTPKVVAGCGPGLMWMLPQALTVLMLLVGAVFFIIRVGSAEPRNVWLLLGYIVGSILSQSWILFLSIEESMRNKTVDAMTDKKHKPVTHESVS